MQQTEANVATSAPGAPAPEANGPSTTAQKAKNLGKGNLLVIGMFLIALGGLYMLSAWRGPNKASAEIRTAELQVDDALARLDAKVSAKTHTDVQALLGGFYGQAKERQISLEALARNPFVYQPVRRALMTAPRAPAEKGPTAAQVQNSQRAEDALKQARALRLQSVLVGQEENSAIISNNLLTTGQKIGGWTVVRIEPGGVTLKYEDYVHELKLPK